MEDQMRIVVAFILAVGIPIVAHGQSPVFEDAMRASATLQLAGQRPATAAPFTLNGDMLAQRRFSSRAPGATLMIIGGASVLAGILVGGSAGTAMIIGGVVAGAYGFYLYNK
jgi:hypothetical protein